MTYHYIKILIKSWLVYLLTMLIIGIIANVNYKKLEKENITLKSDYSELLTRYNELDQEKSIYTIAGELYNIEPELLQAIEILETGHYTSDLYKNKNNTWGAFDGNTYKYFDSPEQSTVELARTLRKYYLDKGLVTLTEIGKVFCPNDPEWPAKVNKIYLQLKGE